MRMPWSCPVACSTLPPPSSTAFLALRPLIPRATPPNRRLARVQVLGHLSTYLRVKKLPTYLPVGTRYLGTVDRYLLVPNESHPGPVLLRLMSQNHAAVRHWSFFFFRDPQASSYIARFGSARRF